MENDDEQLILLKLRNLEKADKVAIERRNKYKNMSYSQILQCPENEKKLQMCEIEQEQTFKKIIKERHFELYPEWKDLFAEYFMDFLKGKVVSINDFLYKDRLANVNKRELK